MSSSASNSQQQRQSLDKSLPSYEASANYKTKRQPKSYEYEDPPIVRPIISAFPQPVTLLDLKKQSACILCPYCSHLVHTKVFGNPLRFSYFVFSIGTILYIQGILPGFFLTVLFIVNAFTIVYNIAGVSHHQCPVCSREIATYNNVLESTYVTAPAILGPFSNVVQNNYGTIE